MSRRSQQVKQFLTYRRRSSIHIDQYRTKKAHHYATGLSDLLVMCRTSLHNRLDSYFISGRKETLQNQEIEYDVHILRLLTDQKHNLQLDPSYVPVPVLNERLSYSFHLPSDTVVMWVIS